MQLCACNLDIASSFPTSLDKTLHVSKTAGRKSVGSGFLHLGTELVSDIVFGPHRRRTPSLISVIAIPPPPFSQRPIKHLSRISLTPSHALICIFCDRIFLLSHDDPCDHRIPSVISIPTTSSSPSNPIQRLHHDHRVPANHAHADPHLFVIGFALGRFV